MREQEAAIRQDIIAHKARSAEYIAYKTVELNGIAAEGFQLQVEENIVRRLGHVNILDNIFDTLI